MATPDAAILALRAAVSVWPDNVPLRQHLAEGLLGLEQLPGMLHLSLAFC